MKQYFLGVLASTFFLTSFSVSAADCSISYHLKGWSAFYKSYKGTGTIRCTDGQSAKVNLSLRGGGLTFGASEITEGKGTLSGFENINDIYGGYFAMDGHAGFGKSIEARLAPKGSRSLTFSGKGRGYNLGWSMGRLNITRL